MRGKMKKQKQKKTLRHMSKLLEWVLTVATVVVCFKITKPVAELLVGIVREANRIPQEQLVWEEADAD
jgi:hypothetical protein